ncbi:Gfo/Idh/MocA family protein [Abditibacterium utsteinense]|nr:Gfo/Idh/MocA family oxidoreductase [Abditibacterium utsteinense]
MNFPLSPVRVGVIGAGIGRQHLRGYQNVSGAIVTAICDLDTRLAAQLAAENGIEAQIFSDYRALLDANCVDAVSLCVPNFLHATVALACLENGLHVLCEKPLAINAIEAQQIADAATKNERVCMVGQVLRFRDDVLALKAEIESGAVGEIYYARAMARRTQGIPKWGGWFTQQKLAGGGPLIDTGVHILDLAWWLSGCPRPISASGTSYAKFGPRKLGLGAGGAAIEDGVFDVEDLAAGIVRFENGLSIHFEAAWAIHAAKDERFCHLHGTEGAILWDDAPKIIDQNGIITPISAQGGDAWTREMAHFIACIQNGTAPDPDAGQGVVMMQILDALAQSAREETEVKI